METGSHKLVPSAKGGTGWRVIFAWVLVAMALTFTVGSIAYDLGQSDAEKNYVSQITGLQEQLKYNEDVRNRLREDRDESESRALNCLRAVDSSSHYLTYKGDILYDVYLADTQEELDRARARVDNWYRDRGSTQEELDGKVAQCVGIPSNSGD